MDALCSLIVIASLLALVPLLVHMKTWKTRNCIPKASGARPIIGHLHLLAAQARPHRVLGDMADKYGPIFTIKLGARRALVVSNWEIVKECLGTNDQYFLTRPSLAVAKYMGYGGSMFSVSEYGPYWRNMRRIITQELLSNARHEQLEPVRSSELNTCLKHLFSLCGEGTARGSAKVDMSEWFTRLSMNVMLQVIARKRFEESDVGEARRFMRTAREFMELFGSFVMSDFIPFVEWMDLKGHIKGMKRVAKELDYFLSRWLEEHLRDKKEGKAKEVHERDFMGAMLETMFTKQYDSSLLEHHSIENVVKSTSLILILAGMDATSITLTWALSLSLNHSDVLKKAQNELDIHVGRDRWVEESDISNTRYIVAIVMETLRLHPPVALNLPHQATEDCYVAGYHIPKGTSLLVNIWKLHRDPLVWSDPDKFQPERFLTSHSKFDVRGNTFKYIPFGAGRRSCPAISYAMQMSCLALARVLQGFNLATLGDENIDMSEDVGVTIPKATPLEVVLTPRLPNELYQNLLVSLK